MLYLSRHLACHSRWHHLAVALGDLPASDGTFVAITGFGAS
jgi:hypothetical protein